MTNQFREDCERYIYLNTRGAIVPQTILKKLYPDENIDYLLSIVDVCTERDDEGERIRWDRIWREWDEK